MRFYELVLNFKAACLLISVNCSLSLFSSVYLSWKKNLSLVLCLLNWKGRNLFQNSTSLLSSSEKSKFVLNYL